MAKVDDHDFAARKARSDVISWHAYMSGMKAGAVSAGIMGVGVYAAHKYWPKFRANVGVSGKTALVVSAWLGAFVIVSEKRLVHGARNPEAYLASMENTNDEAKGNKPAAQLLWWQSLANYAYDSPFRAVTFVGVPLVGGIYAFQASNRNIRRSNQILNTRVYGQGSVVLLLLATMGFHDFMRKHGRFVVPGEQTAETAPTAGVASKKR